MGTTHTYRATTHWNGSTGAGYERYDRAHEAATEPATQPLTLTSDPAFRGDPSHLNPEQLLVLAASSCQLLSFLAVAARARIDVVAYEDDATGEMPEEPRPARVTRIVLRPRITIRPAAAADAAAAPSTRQPTRERLHRLVQVAHRECFIANSLTTRIEIEPTFHTIASTRAE